MRTGAPRVRKRALCWSRKGFCHEELGGAVGGGGCNGIANADPNGGDGALRTGEGGGIGDVGCIRAGDAKAAGVWGTGEGCKLIGGSGAGERGSDLKCLSGDSGGEKSGSGTCCCRSGQGGCGSGCDSGGRGGGDGKGGGILLASVAGCL